MKLTLRPATDVDFDFDFAFSAKKAALGPHVAARWGWDDSAQLETHTKRWAERKWWIILSGNEAIGTVAIEVRADHIRFGEFYIFPAHQGNGIGSKILSDVLDRADQLALPVRLEYLKWNPVGTLYRRHGFEDVSETEFHYFLVRQAQAIKHS